MDSIQWKHFSPDTFRNFCNALLWLEIGNKFRGYEAPGKDGGIDGSFNGVYNERCGTWRFQYKFHSIERKKAFQSLKSELIIELRKIGNENQFILLTNIPLLPKELKTIEAIAQQYLIQEGLTHVQFDIWDGAVLSRLYLKHPLLKIWLEEGYSSRSLVPYNAKFGKQLAASASSIDTLSNFFVSREEELKLLVKFLKDKERHLAIIKGEAGIGKTRLIIEFFKNFIARNDAWTALCINLYHLDFDKLLFSLSNGRNYVLLVDDAQNFTSQQLADLYRLGGVHNGGTIKIIFTIRALASYDAFQLINTFDKKKALLLTLEKLSKEDSKKVFEAHLKNDYLRNFIDQLVLISRGRPILIVGMLHAADKGENISKIKSDTVFTDYVLNYFDSFINIIKQETSIDGLKAKQFLGLVCLLEPFAYDNKENIQKMALLENVSEDFVLFFFKQLKEQGISSGNFQHSIKPDYYSDIFLKSVINSYWLEKKLSQYNDLRSNILTNLASLDDIEKNKSEDVPNFLDKYLTAYIENMRQSSSSETFLERLRLVNSIAFQKPHLAQKAVQIFIKAIQDQEHQFYKDYIANRNPEWITQDTSFSLVKGIFHDLLYHLDYYDFVFDSVLQLYFSTKEKNWFGIFSYQHPVYIYQSSIQIQKFFVKKASQLLPENESDKILFLIHGLHQLLSLSFNTTRWGVLNENTLNISTHFLPKVPVVEQYRLSILSLLKNYYLNYSSEEIKLEALKNILDVPREIAFAKRNKGSFHSDAEIDFILQFLEEHSKDASIGCQKEILDELYWYKYQRLSKKFHPRIRKIEQLLSPQTLVQKFVQTFSHLETVPDDRGKKAKNLMSEIFNAYNSSEIADALCELYHSKIKSYFFSQTIQDFTKLFTSKAKEAYLRLKIIDERFIYDYGSYFLRAFRLNIEYEDFFWQEVNSWLKVENSAAINLLLHTYCIYFTEGLVSADQDSDLIEKLSHYHKSDIEYNLAHALPTLSQISKERSKPILVQFLNKCEQQNAEHLFRLLFNNKDNSSFLDKLILENSIRFTLSHYVENALIDAANKVSSDDLFDYFIQRYNYAINLEDDKKYKYEFVPSGDQSQFTEKLEKEKVIFLFEKALAWFIYLRGDWMAIRLGENLIDYLKPSHDIDEVLTTIFRNIYDECKSEGQAVLKLIDSLSLFHNKSIAQFALIDYIVNDAVLRFENENELISQLKYKCMNSIIEAGGKTGTPGQPFPFDVRLKGLLIEALPLYQDRLHMKEILSSALSYTIATIERDSERYFEEW